MTNEFAEYDFKVMELQTDANDNLERCIRFDRMDNKELSILKKGTLKLIFRDDISSEEMYKFANLMQHYVCAVKYEGRKPKFD